MGRGASSKNMRMASRHPKLCEQNARVADERAKRGLATNTPLNFAVKRTEDGTCYDFARSEIIDVQNKVEQLLKPVEKSQQ